MTTVSVFHVILYQPEIPPNTGNVIRLCANAGCSLHLIEPLGFEPQDRQLKRAGLDYHDWTQVHLHADYLTFIRESEIGRVFTVSSHNPSPYTEPAYEPNDAFVFGPETRGLPRDVRDSVPVEHRITLPMVPGNRSLNLANSVSIIVYEAWRQLGFSGGKAG